MGLFWQQIIIAIAVVAAISYLVYHQIQKRRRKAGCSSCPIRKTIDEGRTGSAKNSSIS